MRLRTLIELLAALMLTFAALFALSKMARTTALKVEKTYALSANAEVETSAVYEMTNDARNEFTALVAMQRTSPACAGG